MKQTESQFYPRIIALVTAGLLGVATFQILQPFLGPLLWAGLFAFILFPVNQALRRAFRGRKGAAALLLTLGVHLVIVFPALLSVGVFVTQSSNLVGRLHAAADRYYIAKASDLFRVLVFERGMRWIWTMVPVTVEQTREWIVRGGERLPIRRGSGGVRRPAVADRPRCPGDGRSTPASCRNRHHLGARGRGARGTGTLGRSGFYSAMGGPRRLVS